MRIEYVEAGMGEYGRVWASMGEYGRVWASIGGGREGRQICREV